MFENLVILYRNYGGFFRVFTSSYFWLACAFTLLSLVGVNEGEWAGITIQVMPSITGFTIAAFAVVFAVLRPKHIEILLPAGKSGKSPLLSVTSAIAHAIVVQISSLIFSTIYLMSDLSVAEKFFHNCITVEYSISILEWASYILSIFGAFLTFYGILLVAAAALSIFRMLQIISRSS